jgi:uncharacterized protein
MDNTQKINKLNAALKKLYYEKSKELLFHGWHHINFVRKKSKIFAQSINANVFIVESAALVHDLNYLAKENSHPEDGEELRKEILAECEYFNEEIKIIENIIKEEHTATRDENISDEAKALSDADTLFKALPFTPILFASKYIEENKIDIKQLADKVTSEQNQLLESGIYFYTNVAKEKYLDWAKINLNLWNNVHELLEDPDIAEVLSIAKELKVL